MNEKMLEFGIGDEKAIEKREKRMDNDQSEFVPMKWFHKLYGHISKVSRQVLRFLKLNFNRKSSHMLYNTHLRLMLLRDI